MNTENFYDRFAPLYQPVELALSWHKRKLIREVNQMPPGKLLEIGVGQGTHLKEYQGHDVYGIDSSEKMLAQARKRNPENLQLKVMNAEEMNFGDTKFDYIVLSHVMSVVDDAAAVMSQVEKILKPRGIVFVLNHFTPPNALALIDKAFVPIGKLLHFRSVFTVWDLKVGNELQLTSKFLLKPLGYFQLLIFSRK
jgi:phosphatidylethanolamine/phosphatidyl-N-methylethanolamine N-methyltransferase